MILPMHYLWIDSEGRFESLWRLSQMTWRCCVCHREKRLLANLEGNVSGEEAVTYGLCPDCYEKALKNIEDVSWSQSKATEK